MKILLVSDNKIMGFGGGCLEERKYYSGLKRYSQDNDVEFKVISPDTDIPELFPIKLSKNKFIDILVRMLGHSSYLYYNWLINKKKIVEYKPDMIVIGRSRFGYMAKYFKKKYPACKIVCNMENVEYDYIDGYFSNTKSILKKLYIQLERKCVKRDEVDAIKYCDALDYLSIRDHKRTHQLYHVNGKREMILPICLEKGRTLKFETEKKNVIFVGSLNYSSNIDAITDFINNVWMKNFSQNDKINLIIGGSNPTDELKALITKIPNCKLHCNFDSLESIVPQNSLMIAPIKSGAGMKVKVAETISMGLPIAASDEALVGYDKAESNCLYGGIARINTHEEYVRVIEEFLQCPQERMKNIYTENKNLFKSYYSYETSMPAIYGLCSDMLNGATR